MASFTPLARVPAYVELAETIIGMILEGTLRPGDFLPVEKELAAQFEVNRSTLREGLRALEESGLVARKGKRLEIQTPPNEALANVIGRAFVLHQVSFDDIYVLTSALLPIAAEFAAKNATKDHIRKLEENLDETAKYLDDPEELAKVDVDFLHLIAEASGNKALWISLEPLSMIFYAGFFSILADKPEANHRLLESHRKIFDAICAGNADEARKWTEKHARDFQRSLDQSSDRLNSPISKSSRVLAAFLKKSPDR